jgi:lipoprotein-anchoring transpeptidase ErfK/SrfK
MNRRRALVAVATLIAVGSAAFWTLAGREAPSVVHASASLKLRVDISERTLYATVGGEERTYPVAVGTSKHPTPRGRFAITRVIWNPRWVPPDSEWARGRKATEPGDPANPMGRVKLFFREPTYFLHGTNDEGSIGRAISHGCIRMRNEDIVALARLVMKHGGQPREPGWFQRVLNRVRSTQEVRLSTPVPLHIVS